MVYVGIIPVKGLPVGPIKLVGMKSIVSAITDTSISGVLNAVTKRSSSGSKASTPINFENASMPNFLGILGGGVVVLESEVKVEVEIDVEESSNLAQKEALLGMVDETTTIAIETRLPSFMIR